MEPLNQNPEYYEDHPAAAIAALQEVFLTSRGSEELCCCMVSEAARLIGGTDGVLLAVPPENPSLPLADLLRLAVLGMDPSIQMPLEDVSFLPDEQSVTVASWRLIPAPSGVGGFSCWLTVSFEVRQRRVAWLVLGRREGCFDEALCRRMAPFFKVCAQLLFFQQGREEYHRLQECLTALSGMHELILESAGEGIYGMDADGRIIFANSLAEEMLGYERGELLGRFSHETVHHSHADGSPYPVDACPVYAALCRGETAHVKTEVCWRKDGTCLPVDYTVNPIWQDGRSAGAVIVFRDISAELRVEARLREKDALFRAAFDNAPIGKSITSLEGHYLEVNGVFCEITGYSREALLGMKFIDITHPDDSDENLALLAQMRTGDPQRAELLKRYRHKDGHTLWVQLNVSGVPSVEGPEPVYFISQVQDVTARKQMEEALRESESVFRHMAEASPQMIWLVNAKDQIVYANKTLLEFSGLITADAPSETQGIDFQPFIHPDDLPELIRVRSGAIRSQVGYTHECRILRGNGEYRWILIGAAPRFSSGGQYMGFVGSGVDITERKLTEQALCDSQQLLMAAQHIAKLGYWVRDIKTDIFEQISEEMDRIYGFSEGHFDRTYADLLARFVHPDDRALVLGHSQRINESGQPFDYAHRIIRPDGTMRILHVQAHAEFDPDARPIRVIGTVVDITERKQIEDALKDSEARFRSAFDHAAIGMALLNPEGRWLQVNRAFCKLTGYSEDELLARDFQSMTHPEDLAINLEYLHSVLRGESVLYQIEKRYIHKAGHPVWCQLNVSPVRNKQGEITYLIAQVQDITDRKQAEEQLHKAKEAAESAASAKAEFLATMSHEIRTPMNAVLGMATLLAETPLSAEQADLVNTIRSGSSTLLGIINDILDFSKIESGKMELDNQPFELKSCIEEAFSLFTQKAVEKGLSLSFQIDAAVPVIVLGDSTRLRQVLVNLVGNAIKFTDRGEIHVLVECMTDEEAAETLRSFEIVGAAEALPVQDEFRPEMVLRFRVMDTGCGIPEDKLQMIFESFTQVAPAVSRRYGGTGLGLAICNRLLRLMGGRICAESRLGEGSLFHFTFPTRSVPWVPLQVPVQDTMDNQAFALRYPLEILVAEDNQTNQKLIMHVLRQLGYRPTLVENGLAVLKVLENDAFDLILMDIQMPEMDGLEATRRIVAQWPDIARRPVIVAMTAFGLVEDRRKCLAVGMDDYLSKPISMEQIRAILCKWSFKRKQISEISEDCGDNINVDLLMRRLGAQSADAVREAMSAMVAMFSEDAPRLLAQAREALMQADFTLLARHLHELKGACMALSATRMQSKTVEAERLAKASRKESPEALEQLVAALSELENICCETMDELEQLLNRDPVMVRSETHLL